MSEIMEVDLSDMNQYDDNVDLSYIGELWFELYRNNKLISERISIQSQNVFRTRIPYTNYIYINETERNMKIFDTFVFGNLVTRD